MQTVLNIAVGIAKALWALLKFVISALGWGVRTIMYAIGYVIANTLAFVFFGGPIGIIGLNLLLIVAWIIRATGRRGQVAEAPAVTVQ